MLSFELQVYKSGKWEFDSYFNDSEIALFEAERLHESDRYDGIRVLKEEYREDSETSSFSVIFSRLRKVETADPRTRATREAYRMAVHEATKSERRQKRENRSSNGGRKGKARAAAKSRQSGGQGSHASLRTLTIMAVLIVLFGVGAMIALRYWEHAA